MQKSLKRMNYRAMSLIEVMVVLLIIGMIMGLVGVGVAARLKAARIDTARTQCKALRTAVKMFQMDKAKLPDSLNDLTDTSDKGPYVEDGILPKDPWDNDYILEVPGENGQEFTVKSYGADGQPGGTDDAADILDIDPQT